MLRHGLLGTQSPLRSLLQASAFSTRSMINKATPIRSAFGVERTSIRACSHMEIRRVQFSYGNEDRDSSNSQQRHPKRTEKKITPPKQVQPPQNRLRKAGVAGESFRKIKWWRVAPSDEGMRLDRFMQIQCPYISFAICNQLIRKRKITLGNRQTRETSTILSDKSLSGARRLLPGEYVHINFDCLSDKRDRGTKAERMRHHISQEQIDNIRSLVIYRDPHFLALNKPSGMPVQGDGLDLVSMLPYLQEFPGDCANEIPRLVHRLDKDTSGVLLLARTRKAAIHLGALFRTKGLISKRYWAVTTRRVRPKMGKIRMPLKRITKGGTDFRVGLQEMEEGAEMAISQYTTLAFIDQLTLLGLEPITGKTHQLRVHCATALDAPILGDPKYGGEDAAVGGYSTLLGENCPLHLHAREISFFGAGKQLITIKAPLPPHMRHTFNMLGWRESEIERTDIALRSES